MLAAALLAALCAGSARSAFAQDNPSAEGLVLAAPLRDSILAVWGTRTLAPKTLSLSISGSYARRPLTVEDRNANEVGHLIGSFSTLELMATVGLFRALDVSVAIPGHRVTKGSGASDESALELQAAILQEDEIALGDIRLTPRLRLVDAPRESGVGLALLIPVWLPTGDQDVYAGEKLRVAPKLAVEGFTKDLMFAVNAGYMFRAKTNLFGTNLDDMVTWGVGAGVRAIRPLWLLIEVSGRVNVMADDFDAKDAPTELLGAVRLMTERFMAQLGGGPGLAGGITEPSWRVLGSLTWLPPVPPPPDRDRDGIPDARDQCVAEPEDFDGFQDDDGCPDLDNDSDGIPDRLDRCPNLAEDDDNFEQEDGCPEPDNDQDNILDAQDACPNVPGSPSSNPAVNGCPDRDGDGIADAQDACPDAPGVPSAEPGKNGCPAVVDRDGDGILDPDDACPEFAGPPHANPAMNGCPRARIEGGQIKIMERIEFVFGKAELAGGASSILEAVQSILVAHPEVTRVTVEGHTDSVGSETYNDTLSRRRAESVKRWLLSHGVDSSRLEARGYGESRPLDTNETTDGRTRNRRVEFHIVEAPKPPPAP